MCSSITVFAYLNINWEYLLAFSMDGGLWSKGGLYYTHVSSSEKNTSNEKHYAYELGEFDVYVVQVHLMQGVVQYSQSL